MRYRGSILLIFVLIFCQLSSAKSSTAMLEKNIRTWFLQRDVDSVRVNLILDSLHTDGTWADIDYTQIQRGSWGLMDHLDRLLSLSIALESDEDIFVNDESALEKIKRAYAYWVENDFKNSNWWHNVIGTQQRLAPSTILLKDHLSKDVLDKTDAILARPKIGMTGQNKVWLSGNVIYYAVFKEDTSLVRLGAQSIKDQIGISDGEGIQADFSYHQHGAQQQFGNYGLSYASEMFKWASILKATPFAFDDEQFSVLRNYLYDGMRWVAFYGQLDISACGRQLFPNNQERKYKAYERLMTAYADLDPKARMRSIVSEGNKYFWRSDYMLHRPASFAASVKMSSKRVIGAEAGNGENLLGYHLGDGAMYIYRDGQEYKDIFPFWDWTQLPGTTTVKDTVDLPVLGWDGYRNNADFVGGVSNGKQGIAAMRYHRDSLEALKSWFMFDDAVVCVGSGINSVRDLPVLTNVNQCFLDGDVIVADNEYIRSLGKGEHFFENLQWAWHDSIGYYFFYNQQLIIKNNTQNGQWNRVAEYLPDTSMHEELFCISIEHNEAPQNGTYAYCVVPGVDRSTMESYFRYLLLENSSKLHVIKDSRTSSYGMVFYEAGGLMLSKELGLGINHPCIVLLQKTTDGYTLSISEPTGAYESIQLSIVGLFNASSNHVNKLSHDRDEMETTLDIVLPKGQQAGSSVNIYLKPIS